MSNDYTTSNRVSSITTPERRAAIMAGTEEPSPVQTPERRAATLEDYRHAADRVNDALRDLLWQVYCLSTDGTAARDLARGLLREVRRKVQFADSALGEIEQRGRWQVVHEQRYRDFVTDGTTSEGKS